MQWIVPANISIFMVWGGIPGILLPQQIALLGSGEKIAGFAIVSTVAGLAALVTQPIAGLVSDRTRSRFGRRTPWIIAGAAASGLIGQVLGSLFFHSLTAGYIVFALIMTTTLVLFALVNPDTPSNDLPRPSLDWGTLARTFWINPIRHPDFFWAFLSRMLLFTGYFCVMGFQLYILTDHLGMANPEAVIPLLGVLNLSAHLPQTLAPSVAGAIVLTVGFSGLFPLGIALGLLGAAAVIPIRAVR